MSISPTQLSLKKLRHEKLLPQVVEHFNSFTNHRIDLFGFIDIVALSPDRQGVVGVQTTSKGGLRARIKKALELQYDAKDPTSPLVFEEFVKAGNRVEFHGWFKKNNRWQVKLVVVDDMEGYEAIKTLIETNERLSS